jgi:putative acetyltransferase
VTVRPEQPADHVAIADVVGAAFGGPVEPRLVEAIRSSPGYRPEMALVAVEGDEVVGHVMISAASLVDEDGTSHEVVSLSPLAVRPDRHSQGIGGALVREALRRAEEAGEGLVLLEGDPRYYGRFGFVDARPHGIRFELPDWAPPEAGQVFLLPSHDPNVRGEVRYPPAFTEALEHDDEPFTDES